jgi:hypothetical protein
MGRGDNTHSRSCFQHWKSSVPSRQLPRNEDSILFLRSLSVGSHRVGRYSQATRASGTIPVCVTLAGQQGPGAKYASQMAAQVKASGCAVGIGFG